MDQAEKKPEIEPGKVVVSALLSGWCPAQNLTFERAKRAVAEFGETAVFRPIDTSDRSTFLEWGICDGLFINKKALRAGPPPSYDKIRKTIARKAKGAK